MEIQDIPNEQMTLINFDEFGGSLSFIQQFIYPKSAKVYFFGSLTSEHLVLYNYLEYFNLRAKVGDTCRIAIKTYVGYPSNDDNEQEYVYSGFYFWEGEVTERILRESSCRIGAFVRKVLVEKVK